MRWGIACGVVGMFLVAVPSTGSAQAPPPLPWDPAPPTPLFMGRFEVDYELVSPRGALESRVEDTNALRVALGINLSQMVSMNFGARYAFLSEDLTGQDFYYFDLLSMGLRVGYDTGHRVILFAGGEASLTGMSVPCDPDEYDYDDCTPTNIVPEFMPRLGLHWRTGANFVVTPGRFEVGVGVSGTKLVPDEGGWFQITGGVVLHWGKPHPSTIVQQPPRGYGPNPRRPPPPDRRGY